MRSLRHSPKSVTNLGFCQPFNLLLLSTQLMSSEFRLVQADIITNISQLRTLLRFCRGRGMGTHRFLLRIFQGSLFLSHDPTLSVIKGTEHGALRSALPKHCTEMPPGLEHSTHYRSVQYSLGHLNCVVQSTPDALCSILPGKIQTPSLLSSVGSATSQECHPHREVAMIQTQRNGSKWKGPPIESLWLSRTPFLLRAYLSDDGNLKQGVQIRRCRCGQKMGDRREAASCASEASHVTIRSEERRRGCRP